MPARTSASTWVSVPATVTGAIAPPTMNGEITQAWFAAAYSSSAPIMTASKVSGELMLISESRTVFSSTNPSPNRSLAISTESAALDRSVTEPMKGLSDSVMWARSMSRWRLFTGRSVGSQTVPPEWWSQFDMYPSFTKDRKSSIVAYLLPPSRSLTKGGP